MKNAETAALLRRGDTDADRRSLAASLLAHRKHEVTSKRSVRIQCAQAAKAFWDRLTPEQKQREMRKRRKTGILRKKQKALGSVVE